MIGSRYIYSHHWQLPSALRKTASQANYPQTNNWPLRAQKHVEVLGLRWVFLYNNSHSLQLEMAVRCFEKEGLSASVVLSEAFRTDVNTIG
jgi:hypothetical protein